MTGAGSPPGIPRQPDKPVDGSAPEPELELPGSLGPWVAALVLWPVIDASAYRLVTRCFGDGHEPEWTFLNSLLGHAGLVEPGSVPDTYTLRGEWLPPLERGLNVLGGPDEARSRLVDAWVEEPDRNLVGEVVRWARDLGRWEAVERVWIALAEHTGELSHGTLALFRDLPLEARRARPMLTWASGAADSVLSDSKRQEGEAMLARLLLDSALLHADWSVRDDTDWAVSAGTFRMVGERRLPTTHAGQSLEAAWRTKQEIDAFIDTRSRAGNGPARTPQAVFRAFSARLALCMGDPIRAMEEARWAALLADWEPVSVLAAGVEALASSIAMEDGPVNHSHPRLKGIDEEGLGVRGLRGMGQVHELLADGNEAFRRLDREGVDRCLALVSPGAASVAGIWSVRAALAGNREALWGNVAEGVNRLSAEIDRQSILGREQEEPLGGALLDSARVLLLTKAGAFGAAIQAAEALAGTVGLLPQARIHLWAGQFKRAVRLADSGPYQAGLELIDRYRLTVLKAAAALLDGTCDAALRAEAVSEMRRQIELETFISIGLLPKPARDVLLDLYRAEGDTDAPNYLLLLDRLRLLNDDGEGGIRPLHLTEREAVLLPLLATEESVPEIARKLHVSVNTVRKQVVTLREKFQADTRAELVRKASAYGAIRMAGSPPPAVRD